MATENDRILRALESLSRAGLLAVEPDARRAELKLGGTGYRCLPAFWEAVGAVVPGAAGFEQQAVALRDPFSRANLHHRVMAEFLVAGAPLSWCNAAAESALGALRGAGEAAAPPRDLQAVR
jgi:hypothetical protein